MKPFPLLFLAVFFFMNASSVAQPPLQWAKRMVGTGSDAGFEVVADAAGNVYSTGCFQNTVDFDPGSGVYNLTGGTGGTFNGYLQKLDASLWQLLISN